MQDFAFDDAAIILRRLKFGSYRDFAKYALDVLAASAFFWSSREFHNLKMLKIRPFLGGSTFGRPRPA